MIIYPLNPQKDLIRLNKDSVRYFIGHHTGNTNINNNTIECISSIDINHKNRGFGCLAYNFIITEKEIIEIRGLNIGAHTDGFNSKSIGYAVLGNLNERAISIPELYNIKKLHKFSNMIFERDLITKSHRDFDENSNCSNVGLSNYSNILKYRLNLIVLKLVKMGYISKINPWVDKLYEDESLYDLALKILNQKGE